MAHNQPIWSSQSGTCTIPPIPPPDKMYSLNQHIWPSWTSFKIHIYTYYYKGPAHLQQSHTSYKGQAYLQ